MIAMRAGIHDRRALGLLQVAALALTVATVGAWLLPTAADAGGKTIVITLRQGVPFHNGKEMTAADVVASKSPPKAPHSSARLSRSSGSPAICSCPSDPGHSA